MKYKGGEIKKHSVGDGNEKFGYFSYPRVTISLAGFGDTKEEAYANAIENAREDVSTLQKIIEEADYAKI